MVSSEGGSTVMYGFGFGVGVPSGVLWSKNSSCWGVDSLAMVGMICTQYNRHFLVCPRAISTQIESGTAIGTEAMACRTVSAVGPSEALQLVGRRRRRCVGFPPQAEANKINRITTATTHIVSLTKTVNVPFVSSEPGSERRLEGLTGNLAERRSAMTCAYPVGCRVFRQLHNRVRIRVRGSRKAAETSDPVPKHPCRTIQRNGPCALEGGK